MIIYYVHVYQMCEELTEGMLIYINSCVSTYTAPDIKDVQGTVCRSVDIITGFMKKHFEITHNGVGPLPAPPYSAWLGDLYPTLTSSAHAVVDINAKWELG